MFFDKFDELCKQKGVSPAKACVDVGLSNSASTRWKKSGSTPQNQTLQKIANYFGVSIDELSDKKEEPVTNEGNGLIKSAITRDNETIEELLAYARTLSPDGQKYLLGKARDLSQLIEGNPDHRKEVF